MASPFDQSLPSSSSYSRSSEQLQSDVNHQPRTGPQRDAEYKAILSKIENDISIIQDRSRRATTTTTIANTATRQLRNLEKKLLSAMEAHRSSLKKKKSLKDLSKSILRLMTKAKEEFGVDPDVAVRQEAEIMRVFELESELAMKGAIGFNPRAVKSTIDLPSQISTYHTGDSSQPVPPVPLVPASLGDQLTHQQRWRRLTSKSTTSLSTQKYHTGTSSRDVGQVGDSHYATLGAQRSPSYAYPQGYKPVRTHDNRYFDNSEQSFLSEAGGQNWDPRYAPQNYDERSYEASHTGGWEWERSDTATPPHRRYSADTLGSYTSSETHPGTLETLTTMEFEDRSEIESQNLHAASAVGEDSNEMRRRARAGAFWTSPSQTPGQGQWPGSGRFY